MAYLFHIFLDLCVVVKHKQSRHNTAARLFHTNIGLHDIHIRFAVACDIRNKTVIHIVYNCLLLSCGYIIALENIRQFKQTFTLCGREIIPESVVAKQDIQICIYLYISNRKNTFCNHFQVPFGIIFPQ